METQEIQKILINLGFVPNKDNPRQWFHKEKDIWGLFKYMWGGFMWRVVSEENLKGSNQYSYLMDIPYINYADGGINDEKVIKELIDYALPLTDEQKNKLLNICE